MTVWVEPLWIVGTLLIAVRLGALLLLSPLFSLARLPAPIGLLLVLVMAVAINDTIDAPSAVGVDGIAPLILAAVRELLLGALLAFGINCAFAAFSFGGRILDLQIGFGVASLVNPSTNEQSPLLGTVLLAVAVLTFFLLNGHHWLARGVLHSFHALPPGAPWRSFSAAVVLQQFGLMFSFGFMLVAPVVAVLLLLDVAIAIASRSMPQMNIFMLSIPIKTIVGLAGLAMSAPYMKGLFARIFESIFTYWETLA